NQLVPIDYVQENEIKPENLQLLPTEMLHAVVRAIPRVGQELQKQNALAKLENAKFLVANIPFDKLAKAKDGEGVRGLVLKNNKIAEHAIFKQADMNAVLADLRKGQALSNAMAIAAEAVGMYYMAEIDDKLSEINLNISKIEDFQDSELKSKISSIISRAKHISTFSSETMQNDGERYRDLSTLSDLEGKAIQVLDQVNIMLTKIFEKQVLLDFLTYEQQTKEVNILLNYQIALLKVLEEISRLNYVLSKGEKSVPKAYSQFEAQLERSKNLSLGLKNWHGKHIKEYQIDLEHGRYRKVGLIDEVVANVKGIFNDDWRYEKITNSHVKLIAIQSKEIKQTSSPIKGIYADDIKLAIKDSQVYLLTD
uniref:hypothetical protein n=1 Tax=Streptococcus merionis TaxID=400065 RepID=UPI0026F2A42C